MERRQGKTVVSLLSGATETIFALGLQRQLIGRSHECDYPPAPVAALPACSLALVDHAATAASIDAQVKRLSETGEPLYRLETSVVDALDPDVLIVQDSCRICAVSPGALADAACLLNDGCHVVTLRPRTLRDVLDDIVTVASALGHRDKGEEYVAQMRGRLAALTVFPPAGAGIASKPRVAVLEWLDPLMSCGYWIPELVEAAGCECVLDGAGEHTGYVSCAELLAARPSHVIIAACGFDVTRCARELW
jgi:iron complex transport system substrate-binding protein